MMNRAAVLASLVLLPALAHADEVAAPSMQPAAAPAPAAPPAPPAPQNEDWSNVSHINGQIVKVGERGDYLIKYKTTNVSGNPFGPFWGYYDLAVAHGVTQNIAIAGSLSGWSRENGDHSGFQATISAPIYFRRTFSGPYLEPGLIMRNTSYNDSYAYSCNGCGDYSYSKTWAGPELLFGWQWTFDSGLNVAGAVGAAKHITDNADSMSSSSSSEPDWNAYFRIGYAF